MSNTERSRVALGFDFGTRRIGIAIGHELTGAARGLVTLRRDNRPIDWDAIGALIDEWSPNVLVVGLPLALDDAEQEMTHAAHRFGRQLHGRFRLPVYMVDERLSSLEADSRLRDAGVWDKRKRIALSDQTAAQIILETWLQDRGNLSTLVH
ncbi:MAG: Holliday junction resolvase RuvX [Chromatiales bacterium]|nr:Holliday junction resolvase RuvX [Chromatiales bacterium]